MKVAADRGQGDRVTRSHLHRATQAAFELEAFAVDFEADYESGDLTITVAKGNKSEHE